MSSKLGSQGCPICLPHAVPSCSQQWGLIYPHFPELPHLCCWVLLPEESMGSSEGSEGAMEIPAKSSCQWRTRRLKNAVILGQENGGPGYGVPSSPYEGFFERPGWDFVLRKSGVKDSCIPGQDSS